MQEKTIRLVVSDTVRVRDVVVETKYWTASLVEAVVPTYFVGNDFVMPICLMWKPALARAPTRLTVSSSFSPLVHLG